MPEDQQGGPDEPRTPCFFFSYARRDDYDQYVKRFFDDLSDRVAQKGARRKEAGEVSFRDVNNIAPGQDWEDEIAKALQTSQALVCLFTTWYFRREYCGKEFQVFLERQPGITYEDGSGAVRNSKRIIPVLWLDRKDLARAGLPPVLVRFIQTVPSALPSSYRERGLLHVLKKVGRRGIYQEVIDDLADRLLDLLAEDLEPTRERPVLARIRSAFHAMEVERMPPAPPNLPGPTADRLRIILLSPPSLEAGAADKLLTLQELAVRQGFDSQIRSDSLDLLAASFRSAGEEGALPVLVLSSRALGEALPVLRQILETESGLLGEIFILNSEGGEVEPILPGELRSRAAATGRLQIRSAADGQEEPVFLALMQELLRRLLQSGEIYRRARGRGPDAKPTLQAPGRMVSYG